jgi:hypothetical protein
MWRPIGAAVNGKGRPMTHHPALLVLLLTFTQPTHTATRTAQMYQGTVHAIQAHPAGLDLVTGVGFALRLVHMRTLPTTSVDSAGTTIPLGHVKPGDVVRADCRMTETGLVADHIEKLGPQRSRETP